MVAPRVFLDFAIDRTPIGRVIFELYNVPAPKTSENFRALCTGECGVSPRSQIPLYYKHSKIHRVIPDFMIQGGDFTKGNGTGGESIYGGPFPDEDLSRPLDEAGLLCMANKGPNTNNSQFFITLRPCPHLNGKHVVFGRVVRRFDDVVSKIAAVTTDERDRPTVPVEIVNCGELQLVKRPTSAAATAPAKKAESESESEEERGRKRKKHDRSSTSRSTSSSETPSSPRRRSLPRSRTGSRSLSPRESERKHHKKRRSRKDKKDKKEKKKYKKHKKRHHSSPSRSRSRSAFRTRSINGVHTPHPPRQETEEEYDARLEREERERLEAARKRELEELKRRYEDERKRRGEKTGGVRFKGRGRMKFIDPELHLRRKD